MALWTTSMQTVALVVVAVVISVAIAFPLGIGASRDPRVERCPVLDVVQAVPPWIHLIPGVIFFSLGRVAARSPRSSTAPPPMLRLTTLAMSQVPKPLLELGDALGATRRTIL